MIDEKKLIEVCRKNSIPDGNIFIENLEEWIEELPKTGEWISASERLPEEDELQPVLVAVMKKHTQASWIKEQETFYFVTDIDVYDSGCGGWQAHKNKVNAWMPLPEPWEGKK